MSAWPRPTASGAPPRSGAATIGAGRSHDRHGAGPTGDTATTDPGLAAETLQAVLRRAAADLAAGDENALTEMRHVLAEHLARRRERVLAACDAVLADAEWSGAGPIVGDDDTGLAAELAAGGSASSWAERTRARTEEAAVATVRVLATRH